MNPLLTLPSDDSLEWVRARIDDGLAEADQLLAQLRSGASAAPLDVWNDSGIALRNVEAVVWLLSEVHPDEEVRTLCEDGAQRAARFVVERDQDRALFDALSATDRSGQGVEAARLLEHTLRDFRRAGVDLDDAARARLREISDRSTEIEQEFSRTVRDDVRSIRLSPDRLTGLPDDYVEAHPPGADGLVTVTTDYPDVVPFRSFARDAGARRDLMAEFLNRGWPDNDALLSELLDLRAEQAAILGYDSWPAFDAEVKMVGSSDAIATFLDRIEQSVTDAAARDFGELLERAGQDGVTTLLTSDSNYYSELVRRERFDVDAQEVSRYFDFGRVHDGLLAVTGRLFGIEYRPASVPAWHEDVTVFDVVADGELYDRIYLDLHPREGKYKHAAQFELVTGVAGRQLPEGALVCNFPRGRMQHSDVVTFFHEFGHLVHHVMGGGQRYVRFSGVATEWDFVEAPSQLLEEWAWDADILRSFAVDDAGTPIPVELVERMRAAEKFGEGFRVRTQIAYANISYRLHLDRPANLTAAVHALQREHDLFGVIDGTHFHAAFGHLTGYSSAYYTYLWSLVIAKDLFSAFDPKNVLDPDVASRYCHTILARGGSADAADLVSEFLGRPYSFDAFSRWLAD